MGSCVIASDIDNEKEVGRDADRDDLLDLADVVGQGGSFNKLEAHLLQLSEVRRDVAISTARADEDEGNVVEGRHGVLTTMNFRGREMSFEL